MLFASLIALPLLAGVLAGTFSRRRLPADLLAGVAVALGIAGAIATALDDDVTGRTGAIAFALLAGALAAGFVYAGWRGGRAAMNAVRHA